MKNQKASVVTLLALAFFFTAARLALGQQGSTYEVWAADQNENTLSILDPGKNP